MAPRRAHDRRGRRPRGQGLERHVVPPGTTGVQPYQPWKSNRGRAHVDDETPDWFFRLSEAVLAAASDGGRKHEHAHRRSPLGLAPLRPVLLHPLGNGPLFRGRHLAAWRRAARYGAAARSAWRCVDARDDGPAIARPRSGNAARIAAFSCRSSSSRAPRRAAPAVVVPLALTLGHSISSGKNLRDLTTANSIVRLNSVRTALCAAVIRRAIP